MSDFEFIIPLKKDDLQISVEGQYFVAEVLPVETILEKLEDCINDLRKDGSTFILKHFDLLYSVLIEFNELDWNDLHKIYDKIVAKSVSVLCNYLEKVLSEESREAEDRIESLNIIKMTLYIYTQYFQGYMNKMVMKTDTINPVIMKGRKKKKLNEQHTEEYSWDWEDKQRDGLIRVQTLLQYTTLCNLWDPPVVEETFVNMIADCCYKALEQSSVNLVKSKYLKTSIINILGILIKQYNHGLSFVVKGVQLLKRHEHVASLLAEAVLKYVTQLGCKSLIKCLIDEIQEASELLSTATDNHCARSFSSFLTELAESNSQEFEPVLDSIFLFLDSELATLRSLGLCVLTEVLLGCLSSDDAEREKKKNRKKCLEALNDHLLDINAHVRTKVLQLWQKIVSQGALPKDWIITLMEVTKERLMDVSSIVTKQAIHLIRLMMQTNPFAAMLSLDELTKTLEHEMDVYKEMKKNKHSAYSGANRESLWSSVEPDLKLFLEEYFKEGSNLRAPPESPDVKRPRVPTINSFISQKQFVKATNLLIYAEDTLSGFKDLRKGIDMTDVDFYLNVFKSIFLDSQNAVPPVNIGSPGLDNSAPSIAALNEEEDETTAALVAQKKRVIFYSDCVEFVKHLNLATEKIVKLLSSKLVFDVIEAIEFVKLAKKFGVAGSDAGVIEMMKLISCPEEGIRNCATRAFEQLYLQSDEHATSPADVANQVVKNLCFLVRSMKLSQEDSLNILIKEWIKSSAINDYCIAAMISTFSAEQPGVTPDDRVAALIIFSSVVQSKPELVNKNLDELIQKGLSKGRKKVKDKDLRIVRHVCEILRHASSNLPSKRFPNDHRIIHETYGSIIEHFMDFNEKNYLYMAESAINLWFKLAFKPDDLCRRLLLTLHGIFVKKNRSSIKRVSESSKISEASTAKFTEEALSQLLNVSSATDVNEQPTSKETSVGNEALTRFIFIVGHVALRSCLYLEQDVLEEKKKRVRLELKERNIVPAPKKNVGSSKVVANDDDEDDELNMAVDVAAANDDALTEEVRNICENEILYGSGIIAKYAYLAMVILQNEGKYSDLRLRSVASVTLGQFMMISNKYCKQNVQLFATLLEKTNDVVVKNNLVVLFGELLFRHPNVIEPWITYLYSRLQDPCRDVRLNTLLVISHLITNEMVKVKAQISDVALCIIDSDDEIKETAARLFHELSLKGNTLYNVLPDIISTLSNPDAPNPLSEENFQKILRYLIELIQKEKQMESLVEKLCVRLRSSESERQWSDLCFCLSLFSYSERSIRKLIDYYASSFATKIICPAVYNCLNSIIGSANKSNKPAVKEAAAELLVMLEESDKVCENCDDDDKDVEEEEEGRDKTTSLGDQNVGSFSARKQQSKFKTPRTVRKGSRSTTAKKSARSTTGRKKSAKDDSDSDDSENEFKSARAPSSRPVRSSRRKLVIGDDDKTSSDEESS